MKYISSVSHIFMHCITYSTYIILLKMRCYKYKPPKSISPGMNV